LARKRGYELGLGIGIATGYATLGGIGFEGRYEYGAVGKVVILASRLSDVAAPGEILLSQQTHAALDQHVGGEPVSDLRLKAIEPATKARPLAVPANPPSRQRRACAPAIKPDRAREASA
jgi:class 3 adenylate cyclase